MDSVLNTELQFQTQRPLDVQIRRKSIPVDFFTKNHRFSANVDISALNVIDSLNNAMTDFLEVKDLYVSRINQSGEIVDTCQTAALAKANIAFAIIPNEHDALTHDHRYHFSKAKTADVKLSVAGFEIQGELEITCKPELNAILTMGTNNFMSIFSGQAVHCSHRDLHLEGSAILVNKSAISYFGLVETN